MPYSPPSRSASPYTRANVWPILHRCIALTILLFALAPALQAQEAPYLLVEPNPAPAGTPLAARLGPVDLCGGVLSSEVTRQGATVVVRRIDPRQLELDIGNGCKIRVQQSQEPMENSTIVTPGPDQSCRIQVDGFTGDVVMNGNADFTRDDPPSLNITFSGNARSGDPDRAGYFAEDHHFSFQGNRRAQ